MWACPSWGVLHELEQKLAPHHERFGHHDRRLGGASRSRWPADMRSRPKNRKLPPNWIVIDLHSTQGCVSWSVGALAGELVQMPQYAFRLQPHHRSLAHTLALRAPNPESLGRSAVRVAQARFHTIRPAWQASLRACYPAPCILPFSFVHFAPLSQCGALQITMWLDASLPQAHPKVRLPSRHPAAANATAIAATALAAATAIATAAAPAALAAAATAMISLS